LLRAYFDESGIHAGSLVVAIGGYVGTKDAWSEIEPKWQSVLDDYADKGVRCFIWLTASHRRGSSNSSISLA
jgi:hypothetical protein